VAVLTIIGNVCSFILYPCRMLSPTQITKLESRPLLLSSFGAVFAISSIVGPLLGGVFARTL
jgi:hypothetical protein